MTTEDYLGASPSNRNPGHYSDRLLLLRTNHRVVTTVLHDTMRPNAITQL